MTTFRLACDQGLLITVGEQEPGSRRALDFSRPNVGRHPVSAGPECLQGSQMPWATGRQGCADSPPLSGACFSPGAKGISFDHKGRTRGVGLNGPGYSIEYAEPLTAVGQGHLPVFPGLSWVVFHRFIRLPRARGAWAFSAERTIRTST